MKTFHVTLEGPGNAVTTNKDSKQVAVAGRNVFKIYEIDIENNNFVEKANLRSGKNLNLNFSSNDVAWNAVDESLLATGATNGAVVIWNLGKSGRSKMEVIFQDHRRTVNTVCFHPSDVNLLVSCSQDGTMKLFDLRQNQAVSTFDSRSESVRDLQFSPYAMYSIASVQENGNVQLWDFRNFNRPERQFTAHNGPVFSVDWHPLEKKWLSTAGRDKMIKVWDMESSQRATLEYCIQTIAPVARVRWRPHEKFQIASSSLVVDFSVSVWDIRRPYIPYATFTEHKDITRGFVWINSQTLLSAGKDNTLYHHSFEEAVKPLDSANPIAINISNYGDIALAVRDDLIQNNIKDQATASSSTVVNPSSLISSSVTTTGVLPSSLSSSSSVVRRVTHQSSLTATPAPVSSSSSSKIKRDRSLVQRQTSLQSYSSPAVSSSLPSTSVLSHPTSLLVETTAGCTTTASMTESSLVVSPVSGSTSPQLTIQSSLFSNQFQTQSSSSTSKQLSVNVDATTPSTAGTTTSNIITSLFSGSSSTLSNLATGKIANIFRNKSSSSTINNNIMSSTSSSGRGSTRYSTSSPSVDFAKQCTSSVFNYSHLRDLSMDWFTETAVSYNLTGKSFDEICQLNADVCHRLGRITVLNAWKIIREKYSNKRIVPQPSPKLKDLRVNSGEIHPEEGVETSNDVTDSGRKHFDQSLLEEERDQQRLISSQLIASTVIGPLRHVNGNQFIPSITPAPTVPNSPYVHSDVDVSSFKERKRLSFHQRMSIQSITSLPGSDTFIDHSDSDDSYVNIYPVKDEEFSHREAQRESEKSANFFFGDGDWPFGLSVQDLLSPLSTFESVMDKSKGFDSGNIDSIDCLPVEAFIQRHAIPDLPNAPLSVAKALSRGSPESFPEEGSDPMSSSVKWIHENELRSVAELLCQSSLSSSRMRQILRKNEKVVEHILRYFAAEGDVQSCVSLLLVLGERISFNEIDELTQEKWFTAYIDLLSRFQLWSVATKVITLSKIPNINGLNQNSTNVNLCCGVCGKLNHGTGPFVCKSCNTNTCVCVVCQEVVYGLYAWCEGCSHGGHLLHLKDWYDNNTKCPLDGCTHECEYS